MRLERHAYTPNSISNMPIISSGSLLVTNRKLLFALAMAHISSGLYRKASPTRRPLFSHP
jgi:hypothetical protein